MKPEDLIKHAIKAQNNAQAKYSNFYVGCAQLTAKNEILDRKKQFLNRQEVF